MHAIHGLCLNNSCIQFEEFRKIFEKESLKPDPEKKRIFKLSGFFLVGEKK